MRKKKREVLLGNLKHELDAMPMRKEQRGDIIERAANIESMIGCVLSMKYFGRVRKCFTFDLLADEYCPFALKRRVLLKLVPELNGILNFEENLNRLNTIRNYFAHVGLIISDGPEPGVNARTPDPRQHDKSVDFPALYKEFLEKEKPVIEALFGQYKKLGGTFTA